MMSLFKKKKKSLKKVIISPPPLFFGGGGGPVSFALFVFTASHALGSVNLSKKKALPIATSYLHLVLVYLYICIHHKNKNVR